MSNALLAVVDVAPDLDAFWGGVQVGGAVLGVVIGLLIVVGAIRRFVQV